MTARPTDPEEHRIENARRIAEIAVSPPGSPILTLGGLLHELDAWLGDDRQWRSADPGGWRTLIGDVRRAVHFIQMLSSPPHQEQLIAATVELDALGTSLGKGVSDKRDAPPDDVLRRRLIRVVTLVRNTVVDDQVLASAWNRTLEWMQAGNSSARDGAIALRDLADLRGQDPDDLFARIIGVLSDNAGEVEAAKQQPPPADPKAAAGVSAHDRLELVMKLLTREPHLAPGVVWLQYLQAQLWDPWVLHLGDSVALYQDHMLRSLLINQPDDDRLPSDLRGKPEGTFDVGWFGADPSRPPDPSDPERVFIRIELPQTPRLRLLAEAREIAEFLVAFGALRADNDRLWLLSDNDLVRGWRSSVTATVVNAAEARRLYPTDTTALALSESATDLGAHLPVRTSELRTAGLLLVWLRQASASSNPAKVVLCDRVVEQVCGWAGIARMSTFVADYLKPAWINTQLRNRILGSLWQLWNVKAVRESALANKIQEPIAVRPPHAPPNYTAGMNLKVALEHLDQLLALAGTAKSAEGMTQIRDLSGDKQSMRQWLTDLGNEFESRNAVLRRTRNALVHGGPLSMPTVDYVSDFSMTLAYHALGPAIGLMLRDKDLVDGFLDHQIAFQRSMTRMRDGVPLRIALFWNSD
jgi:hypothetical protein